MTREQMIEAMARAMCPNANDWPCEPVCAGCKRMSKCALDAVADALRNEGRMAERADVVASLRESAAWHNKADDGLSGYAAISNALIEHADAIQRGEHVGGGDVADD